MSDYDSIVIGGGAIGCAVAWRLAMAGRRVVLFERGEVGREATYAAGGMLAPLSEADENDAFLRLCRQSLALYPDFARQLEAASGIGIEYRTEGTLFLSLTAEDDEELDRRYAWQRAAGIDVERLSAARALALEPSLSPQLRFALSFPDDHQVNNRRLIEALRAAALSAGVEIASGTPVRRILVESVGGRLVIRGAVTDPRQVSAPQVVLAAGSWSSLLLDDSGPGASRVRVEPVRGQMISVARPADGPSRVIYSRRGYLVPRLDGAIIAGSTTERAGYARHTTPRGLATITAHATEIMPCFDRLPIVETWAGLRPHAPDSLPILGPDPRIGGLIHATAHYRNGILLTPLTAAIVASLAEDGRSPIDLSPFSPARFAAPQAAD